MLASHWPGPLVTSLGREVECGPPKKTALTLSKVCFDVFHVI